MRLAAQLSSSLALLLLGAPAVAQTTLHVDAAAPPGGTGASFASALTDLQDALDAARLDASVTEIRVAEGRYRPDRGTLDRTLAFELVDGVALLGGYPSGGGARDPRAHPTVLDGDLAGNDGPPQAAQNVPNRFENSIHVVRATGVGAATLLDGFVVTAGYAEPWPDRYGGGMLATGGAPTLRGCTFDLCGTEWLGGGLALRDSAALVEDCLFSRNRGGSGGGGALVSGTVAATFRRCTFRENVGGAGAGLAIGERNGMAQAGNATRVEACLFLANEAIVGATAGGGLYAVTSTPTVVDCTFRDNFANGGGGLFVDTGSAWVERCEFVGNRVNGDGGGALSATDFSNSGQPATVVVSCAMHGNDGGLVAINQPVRLVNVTLAANQAPGSGPGSSWPAIFAHGTTVELWNSIVWGNDPLGGFGDERDHLVGTALGNPSYLVDHSIVEGWTGVLGGVGSGADPRFLLPAGPDGDPTTLDDNDWRLRIRSPALDAGSAALLPAGVRGDVDGGPRFLDADGDGVRQIDLGAWERPRFLPATEVQHP
ncbi:MAG: right-handed parallel beta-helix repeat-containing protein [Planctomycetes bacterium]|nr:right-handed parallel beta-helix repeat-containing protein [Planctomycetota bacterium]